MASRARMSPTVLTLWAVIDLRLLCSASLVNGEFPGPLITAQKVNHLGRFFDFFFILNLHSLGRRSCAQRF